MNDQTVKPFAAATRRQFLHNLLAVAGGVAAWVVAGQASAEQAAPLKRKSAAKGYRETEHIRAYYRAARF